MNQLKTILFVIGICLSTNIYAQDSKLTIGQSTSDELVKAKSAQIVATFPKNDTISDSYLVDGFIEYSRTDIINSLDIGVFVEIHKNNLLSKDQDVRQFGLNLKKIFGTEGKYKVWFNTTLNLKQSNDRIKKEEAFQAIVSTTAQLINRPNNWNRILQVQTPQIDEQENLSDYINLSHNHSIGIGYIGGIDDVLLVNGSFEVNIFPFSTMFSMRKKRKMERELKVSAMTDNEQISKTNLVIEKESRRFRNIFVINWTIQGRKLISGETDRDLQTFNKISGGLIYNISDKSSFGLMYSYQTGADPYSALSNQTFSSITATLKLSI